MIAAALAALALQAAPYGTISVAHTGTDRTGRAIALRLEDELRRSRRFDVVSARADTGFSVWMTSVETDHGLNSSVFDVVLTDSRGTLIAHTVGICRADSSSDCASRAYEWLIPMVDEHIRRSASSLVLCAVIGQCD